VGCSAGLVCGVGFAVCVCVVVVFGGVGGWWGGGGCEGGGGGGGEGGEKEKKRAAGGGGGGRGLHRYMEQYVRSNACDNYIVYSHLVSLAA